MELRLGVTGAERKKLVSIISEIVDSPPRYLGAPTFAYEVGDFTVDKEGTLSRKSVDSQLTEKLEAKLTEMGFKVETPERLTIEMPLEGFTEQSLENLNKLIASKATLIKKAIGTDVLPVVRTEDTLKFPWFPMTKDSEVEAYTLFVNALCRAAKERKRITAKEKPVENERFTFRVFIVQLGFVGDKYKTARKILLKNLSGNSAFKNGMLPKREVKDNE